MTHSNCKPAIRWARALLLLLAAASAGACGTHSSHPGDGDAGSDAGGASASDAGGPRDLTGQGCHRDRPASAYAATATGSRAVASTASLGQAPIPCLVLTGYGASESSLGFTSDGTLFFGPASAKAGNGIVRSRDDGASFQLLVPKLPDGTGHTRLEPFLYVDPTDDHVYFASSKLVLNGISSFKDQPGIHLSVSSDQGETWSYQSMAPQSRDWEKLFGGARPKPQQGHVVYFSAPSPIAGNWSGIYPPPDKQYVYKSLDHGKTWQDAGTLPLQTKLTPGCTSGDYVMFGSGAVGPDGSVYLGYRMCTQLAVAVSTDEGKTWVTRQVTGATLPAYDTSSLTNILAIVGNENAITGEPVTVDAQGNLYAVWADAKNTLHLSTSQDQGQSWSAPVGVMAPGVKSARFAALATKAPGTLALAYFGSTDGSVFDGYVAETRDAFAATPTFWSAAVSEPGDALYPNGFASGYDASYFSNGGDGVEFVQVKYAPSGDIWASFVKNMCPTGTSSCSWDYAAHANSRFQGALGRLVHVR